MKGYSAFVAVDSFKGSLSTEQANDAVKQALLKKGFDEGEIHCFPVADGGEGFCSVIASYVKAVTRTAEVKSPLGSAVKAGYLLSDDGTAYIETATACGYTLVPKGKRDPFLSSSFGLGQLILSAVSSGARKLVIGLGGTATSDGGLGALQALGVRFYTETPSGVRLLENGIPALLQPIVKADFSAFDSWKIPVELWSDTNAVYCGQTSAMRMYGRQKGLKAEDVDRADEWMEKLTALFGRRLQDVAGTGAAGGLGGALYMIPGAVIKAGADALLELAGFSRELENARPQAAVVFTGEGKFDEQTVTGKMPARVADAAARAEKKMGRHIIKICVCGCAQLENGGLFDKVLAITPAGMPLEEALLPDVAAGNMIRTICEEKTIQ